MIFLLFTARVRSQSLDQPLVPGVIDKLVWFIFFRFIDSLTWRTYAELFRGLWTASAFKVYNFIWCKHILSVVKLLSIEIIFIQRPKIQLSSFELFIGKTFDLKSME